MITNIVCHILPWHFVASSLNSIPLVLPFNLGTTSDGAKKSRKIFACAVGTSIEPVHCYPSALLCNQDDMVCIYTNWKGDGSCIGQMNQANEKILVSRSSATDKSYEVSWEMPPQASMPRQLHNTYVVGR